jgi:lysophospholipase L1-like esterase
MATIKSGSLGYKGDVWAWVIYAEKPIPHLLGGVGALFAGYVILFGHRNTRRQWARFAGRVVLLVFSFTLSLLAAEIGLRAYLASRQNTGSIEELKEYRRQGKKPPIRSTHPLAMIVQPSDDLRVVYELQPNLDVEFGHRRLKTNADGMRESRDYPVARSANSVRIVGIGDSGMFGWDLEPDEDYMSVMENNLNARQDGTLYEVLNLGVPGYNTQLEVEMLRCKGLKFKPDIVVVGWCENDFSLPYFFLEKENYRRRDKSFLLEFLFRRAQTTEIRPGVSVHDLRRYDKSEVMPEITTGTNTEGVRKALVELKAMGTEHGFKVIVFGPLHHQIRQLCTEVGVPMANTLDLIPSDKYPKDYLVYYMHPPKEGHRVLAEYLAKDLADRGWLTPSR